MAQYGRPASDVSTGNWTTTPLYSKLNEASYDDASYIQLNNSTASAFEVSLGTLYDPSSSSGHIIRVRVKKTGSGTITETGYLMQGSTQIATWSISLTTSYNTVEYTLSAAEANAITNYADLRVRVSGVAASSSRYAYVSWIEAEVPNVAITVNSTVQAQTAGNVTLTATDPVQNYTLVVQNATQAQSSGNTVLAQNYTSIVNDAAQTQTAENTTLTYHEYIPPVSLVIPGNICDILAVSNYKALTSASAATNNLSTFTVDGWFKSPTFSGGGNWQVDKYGWGMLEFASTAFTFYGCFTGNGWIYSRGSTLIDDNKWHYLKVTYDVAENKFRLYVDSTSVEETYTTQQTGVGTLIDDSGFGFQVGNGTSGGFIGSHKWVRLSNIVRGTETVDADTPPQTDANTVILLPVNEGEGSILNDVSGYDNDANLTGSYTWEKQTNNVLTQTADGLLSLTYHEGVPQAIPDNATQAQTADGVTLTQHQVLVTNSTNHAQTVGTVGLTQHQIIVVGGATQAQTAGAVTLTQHQSLAVGGATQAQTAQSVVLTAYIPTASLTVANASQAQTAGGVSLTQHQLLAVNSTVHAQTSGNTTLTQHQKLAVDSATQAQISSMITLEIVITAWTLAVQNATHLQTADNLYIGPKIYPPDIFVGDITHSTTTVTKGTIQINNPTIVTTHSNTTITKPDIQKKRAI